MGGRASGTNTTWRKGTGKDKGYDIETNAGWERRKGANRAAAAAKRQKAATEAKGLKRWQNANVKAGRPKGTAKQYARRNKK